MVFKRFFQEREEREKTHTQGLYLGFHKGLSLSLSLSFFSLFSLLFFFFFLFLFSFSFSDFFSWGKKCCFSLSLSLEYIYTYTHTHFWLDLGGEKGEALLLAKTESERDFFFQSSYIYIYIYYKYIENMTKSSSSEEEEEEKKSDLGVFGMGVMGQNLALNVASKNFSVSCYNRKDEFSDRLFEALEIAKNELSISIGDDVNDDDTKKEQKLRLKAHTDLEEFVKSLKKPRRILLSIPAGKPVEMTLEALKPLVESDDVIIDGGKKEKKRKEKEKKKEKRKKREREREREMNTFRRRGDANACAPSIGQTRRPKERTLKGFISSAWAFPAAQKARDTDRRSCPEALNSRITV